MLHMTQYLCPHTAPDDSRMHPHPESLIRPIRGRMRGMHAHPGSHPYPATDGLDEGHAPSSDEGGIRGACPSSGPSADGRLAATN